MNVPPSSTVARPANILLIEDDVIAARMVIKLLTLGEHQITHARTGTEGINFARTLNPQLVLVDLGLPDLDGKLVALQLNHILEPTRSVICAFTAESGAKAKRLALAYGCAYFLSKPIDTRAFPTQIADLLKKVQKDTP